MEALSSTQKSKFLSESGLFFKATDYSDVLSEDYQQGEPAQKSL